jgi:hypothetical protein
MAFASTIKFFPHVFVDYLRLEDLSQKDVFQPEISRAQSYCFVNTFRDDAA